jgi:hypothetical protein
MGIFSNVYGLCYGEIKNDPFGGGSFFGVERETGFGPANISLEG